MMEISHLSSWSCGHPTVSVVLHSALLYWPTATTSRHLGAAPEARSTKMILDCKACQELSHPPFLPDAVMSALHPN